MHKSLEPTEELEPTDEQAAILDRLIGTEDNIFVRGYAGCGKSSTLEMMQNASK